MKETNLDTMLGFEGFSSKTKIWIGGDVDLPNQSPTKQDNVHPCCSYRMLIN
jgi:hypothetical protein